MEWFTLNNFLVTSEYSQSTTSGGIVVILSKMGLNSKGFSLTKINKPTEDKLFKCCIGKYKLNKWYFVLEGIYRKPQLQTLDFFGRLNQLLEVMVGLKDETNFVIAGDLI